MNPIFAPGGRCNRRWQQPVQGQVSLRIVRVARIVWESHLLGRAELRLERNGRVDILFVEVIQPFIQDIQALVLGIVAVEVDIGIRRVVIDLMEGFEGRIGEVGNGVRIAARIEPVGVIGEERSARFVAEQVKNKRPSSR